MSKVTRRTAIGLGLASVPAVSAAVRSQSRPEPLSVGYFLEWPMPMQYAQATDLVARELGRPVVWKPFETGALMSRGLAAGDIQIAFSQGLAPFLIAVTAGLPITAVAITASYTDNDNCVVHDQERITRDTAVELHGKRIAVALNTASHYRLLRILKIVGVDPAKVTLLDRSPPDAAAALARRDVAMACGWGGGLKRMKQFGAVLIPGSELEAAGSKLYDLVTVSNAFLKEQPTLVSGFLRVMFAMNARWNSPERPGMTNEIARASGMRQPAAEETLAAFNFLPAAAQLSPDWLGGFVQSNAREVAQFLVAQKVMPVVRDSYAEAFDTRLLKVVAADP